MANFAKLEGTVSGISQIDSNFTIHLESATRSVNQDLTFTCKTVRSIAYQYKQGSGISDQAINIENALTIDIPSVYITILPTATGFTIEANEYDWEISHVSTSGTTNVYFTETPEVLPTKNFQLTSFTVSDGATPCIESLITINQNGDGVAPFTWVSPSNPSTTLQANLARTSVEQTITVTLQDSEGDNASLANVFIPKLFSSADITSITSVTNVSGLDATVTIVMATSSIVDLYEYSIDGTNFQSSNIFTTVLEGSYTLYVHDGLGCIVTTPFDVDLAANVERATPTIIIPLANSLRMLPVGAFPQMTVDNTLYRDRIISGRYHPPYAQPYQNNDGIITTQYHTTYDAVSARILDCDDNIVRTLTPEQKSNNVGLKDKRDAIAFNRGNNQTGIYFTSGNIYDPDTSDVTDSYELNGSLPDWGKIGNTVILSGSLSGSYLIKQSIYDSDVKAYVLVIDLMWTSSNSSESVIVECTYDKQIYETFEIYLDMGETPFLDGVYYQQIVFEDSLEEWPDVVANSVLFYVKDTHDHTNVITYDTSNKTGIIYSTGYQGKLRLHSVAPDMNPEDGSETALYTDTNGEETITNYIEGDVGSMHIVGITADMVQTLKKVVGHSNIYVNGEKWTATEGVEVENFQQSEVKNASIKFKKNNIDEYNTDNILIDGETETLDQETAPILI